MHRLVKRHENAIQREHWLYKDYRQFLVWLQSSNFVVYFAKHYLLM